MTARGSARRRPVRPAPRARSAPAPSASMATAATPHAQAGAISAAPHQALARSWRSVPPARIHLAHPSCAREPHSARPGAQPTPAAPPTGFARRTVLVRRARHKPDHAISASTARCPDAASATTGSIARTDSAAILPATPHAELALQHLARASRSRTPTTRTRVPGSTPVTPAAPARNRSPRVAQVHQSARAASVQTATVATRLAPGDATSATSPPDTAPSYPSAVLAPIHPARRTSAPEPPCARRPASKTMIARQTPTVAQGEVAYRGSCREAPAISARTARWRGVESAAADSHARTVSAAPRPAPEPVRPAPLLQAPVLR